MIRKTVEFTDFNGNKRKEDLYFNLTVEQLLEMQGQSLKGIEHELQRASEGADMYTILNFVKTLMNASYGIKSDDGRHFRKSPEILKEFQDSAAYSPFLIGLFENDGKGAADFIQGVIPPELMQKAKERQARIERGEEPAPDGFPFMGNPAANPLPAPPVEAAAPQQFTPQGQAPQYAPQQASYPQAPQQYQEPHAPQQHPSLHQPPHQG